MRRAQSGFTLLELILSLAVTCMLAVALYASLSTAFHARERATAAVEPARAAQVALDLIARDLKNALVPDSTAGSPLVGTFYGQPMGSGLTNFSPTLEFYAVCDGSLSSDDQIQDPTLADGIKRIDILIDTLPDGTHALVRRVGRNLLALEDDVPDQDVLCRNVSELDIEYCDGEDWTDTWDSTAENDAIPTAVRLTIVIDPPASPNGTPSGAQYTMSRVINLPAAIPVSQVVPAGTQ